MNYLSYSKKYLESHNAYCTAKEISQQPEMWRQTWQQLNKNKTQWQNFLTPLLTDPNLEIILTGAGSSAFIGETLAPWLRENTNLNVYAYGSTEIVSNPFQYLSPNKKTLMISYARSGNSPESLATVQLANQVVKDCYHIFITCNPKSALTNFSDNPEKTLKLITPEGTHDIGFAMTSSISSMMLTTILVLGYQEFMVTEKYVEQTADICHHKLNEWQDITKNIAAQPIERIIYIGSSCFKGLSLETALKVLELTAGKIATRYDSTLGLRHGPKFMINDKTLVVCMLSNDPYTRQYDDDLLSELIHDNIAHQIVALSGKSSTQKNILSLNSENNDIWLVFPYLLFAQMLAFEKSLALGMTPDNPCPTGEVNRVVKGVNIYPLIK